MQDPKNRLLGTIWSLYVIGQNIIFSSCGFFFFFFSSPNLSGRRLDAYHTSTVHTWCGPGVNLECRSEMCCTRLAENTGRKTRQEVVTCMGTIPQRCRTISSQLRHVSTIGKKLVKQQYLPHMPLQLQYGELRPTSG